MSITLLTLTFAYRMLFYSPFLVDGDSMYPTLSNGELFVLDKWEYREHEPKRGDIIVFYNGDKNYFYVKRVIGLPEETVKISQMGVFIKQKNTEAFTKLDE